MSLKKMAMKMAIAFAAAKGYEQFRSRGGMAGVRDMLAQGGGGRSGTGAGMARGGASGGMGGLMSALGGGGSSAAGGGLGGLLGALSGGSGMGASGIGASSLGRSGMGGGMGGMSGMGGLLGGLAAMAGGGAAASAMPQDERLQMAETGVQDEATAAAMVRAIGQAVRADGHIDDDERAVLDEIVGEAETEADRQALDRALSEPVNPEALARDVPRGHEGEVYASALTAIDIDHQGERDFLRRFATALALEPDEVARLHEAAGKPA